MLILFDKLQKSELDLKDLDLCVSKELFENMIVKFNIVLSSNNDCGFYCLNGLIEVVVNNKQVLNIDFRDGYPVEALRNILDYKIGRNVPKNQADIVNIQKYLNNQEKQIKKEIENKAISFFSDLIFSRLDKIFKY